MLSAQAEAAIDYAGDEEETEVDGAQLAEAGRALALELDQWLAAPRTEGLRDGIRVVLAGPPNAGKSSLLNALAGEDKAIVSAAAGTTRDVIDVPIAINGVPLRLIDTAGLRESIDVVEAIGVQRAKAEVDAGDVLLWLGDPLETPDHPCVILVHARSDEAGRPPAPRGAVACSAHTGAGLSELKLAIVHRASELLPGPDAVVLNRRQADRLRQCRDALMFGARSDIVLTAEALRSAREALDHVSGFSSVEDVLDALFGRFCLGK
jgi:tRNA modification GTPase